ncbi:methyltransferase family protein [Paractinoplanes maris]|uniref:methyltransferase family protein n=1 Tax=Paractinoplanes maris TaxID=1734446 RepID=UPI002021D531|nr:isoprenylcysteine carboxylmethyltransferase family protein [Actinoplanes maris]
MALPVEAHRGARVILVPPPLYYVAAFALGLVAQQVAPLPIGGRPATLVLGIVVAVLGAALTVGGVRGVLSRGTTIVPHRPVTTLVTTGAYRVSRNPMYAGLAAVHAGGALVVGSWWPLLLVPLPLVAIQLLVVGPEERYLSARFGEEYDAYRARVRRWL